MQAKLHDVYVPLVTRIVDACITDLFVGIFDHRFPWDNKLATRRWTKLIGDKKYAAIAERANFVYNFFEQILIYVPLVQAFGKDGLHVTWEEDGKLIAFTFTPHATLASWADTKTLDTVSTLSDNLDDWSALLHVYALHLKGACDLEFIQEIRAGEGSESRWHGSSEVN